MNVPSSAAWLGGLGAVPFVCLAGAMPFLPAALRVIATHGLVAYGATILSFLAGIHWGLAIGNRESANERELAVKLISSVIPSLLGWIALLIPAKAGLFILAAAIAAMLMVDIRMARRGRAPAWYPKLRIPLTCVVTATLIFAAIA